MGWGAPGGSVVTVLCSQGSLESRVMCPLYRRGHEARGGKENSGPWGGAVLQPRRDPMRCRERGPPGVTEGQGGDQDTWGLKQGH